MQSESRKRSKYIFQSILDQQQLTNLIQLEDQILKQFVKRCAKFYLKAIDKNIKHVYIYLANQKNIMQIHSKKKANALSVQLCLHFALMFSEYLIRQGRQAQAKKLLKQTQQYTQLSDHDIMLQVICLNNLSVIYKKRHKYKRSLESSLKGVSIIKFYLQDLFCQRNKKRIIEDGIIYVNLLAIAQSCLKQLISKENSNQISVYQQLLKIVAKLGYNFSFKYYGENSFFTKKFHVHLNNSLILPIFVDESSQQSINEKDQFVHKISNELQNIYGLLRNLKLQPQIYYVNVVPVAIEPQPQQIVEIPEYKQQDIIYIDNIIIADWDVQISFIKQKEEQQNSLQNSIGIQSLNFKLQRQNKKINFFISRQKMIKIVNVINYFDILPYESCLASFDKQEFIRKFLLHFMKIENQGNLIIYPKAIPIIQAFEYTFLNQTSLIFINHIQFRKFRIAINLIKQTEPYYLQFQIKQKDYNHLFILHEIQHKFINKQSQKYNPKEQYQSASAYNSGPFKVINLISPELFKEKVIKILRFLEQFLKEQQQNDISQLASIYDITHSYHVNYFHYIQFQENIGQIYYIKHKINTSQIEINMKNTFKTYGIGKIQEQAKGNIVYSLDQFYKDFGVHLKHVLKHILVFFQLILQKYFIKIYQKPLSIQEENIFDLNSIAELPFMSKCFFRKFLLFQDYYIPITIELISLNGQKPIGIRVSAYQPIKGTHSGLFIHIVPEYWEKPALKNKQVINADQKLSEKLKKTTNDYSFKKNYFLANWMQEQGFKIIFKHITITNRILEIKGVGTKFILLDQILALS